MSAENSNVSILFIFKFKGVAFDTDEGMGQDESLANLLNKKYGNQTVEVRSSNEQDALTEAIDQLTEMSGFCVLDADYDVHVS